MKLILVILLSFLFSCNKYYIKIDDKKDSLLNIIEVNNDSTLIIDYFLPNMVCQDYDNEIIIFDSTVKKKINAHARIIITFENIDSLKIKAIEITNIYLINNSLKNNISKYSKGNDKIIFEKYRDELMPKIKNIKCKITENNNIKLNTKNIQTLIRFKIYPIP